MREAKLTEKDRRRDRWNKKKGHKKPKRKQYFEHSWNDKKKFNFSLDSQDEIWED